MGLVKFFKESTSTDNNSSAAIYTTSMSTLVSWNMLGKSITASYSVPQWACKLA